MRYKILLFIILINFSKLSFAQGDKIIVPVAGNYYSLGKNKLSEDISVYVRFAKTGKISMSLALSGKAEEDLSLSVKIKDQTKKIIINKGEEVSTPLEGWNILDTGYVAIEIKYLYGLKKQTVKNLIISGTAVDDKMSFVKNNEGNFFYWGRRGPSVHLNYQMPTNTDAEWFYNELTVPTGNDVIGSYFMANGFGEGYFGIQVNSATERRVLFSVWSPFTTDNPKSIPESHQIKMLKKGEGVHTGEFGNEGSGGQSYLKYNWKAGNTYKFLLQGLPSNDSTTTYTAYFFAPELNKWQLIASFKRPKTQTYLKRPHSFLENFIPDMGDKQRKVLFNNQWICDTKGNWIELDKATFTIDNTGRMNYRKDYAGGIANGSFYLENCGFFSNFTPARTVFSRTTRNQKPDVDLNKLP